MHSAPAVCLLTLRLSLISLFSLALAHSQERISELETQAMADKAWQLRGESDAARRPLNSALEVDLDFDTTGMCAWGWGRREGNGSGGEWEWGGVRRREAPYQQRAVDLDTTGMSGGGGRR